MHRELIEETDVRGKRPELGGLCKFACDNKIVDVDCNMDHK